MRAVNFISREILAMFLAFGLLTGLLSMKRAQRDPAAIRRTDRQFFAVIWIMLSIFVLVVAIVMLVLMMGTAHGRDLTGQYANSPNSEWVSTRKNKQGVPCCEVADGIRLDDVDWKSDGDTYSVRVDGMWIRVDPDKVLTEPNKLGQAMVWIWHGMIMCFIPGSGS